MRESAIPLFSCTLAIPVQEIVKPLTAASRRVIVPDMIGFDLSEKPVREQAHSLDGHIANLTSLLRQLDVRNATWSITIGAARPVSALHSPILTAPALS